MTRSNYSFAIIMALLLAPMAYAITGYVVYTIAPEGGVFPVQTGDIIQPEDASYQLRITGVGNGVITLLTPTGSYGMRVNDVRSLDVNKDGTAELRVTVRAVDGPHATLILNFVSTPRLVSTTGEDLLKSGAASIDESGAVVVNVEKTQEVQLTKRSGFALLLLLVLAVGLGALLSMYALYHHNARKHLAGTHEHLLLDYVAKLRKVGHKDIEIVKRLVGMGHSDTQAKDVLARAPTSKRR